MRSENQRKFQTAQYATMFMVCYLEVIRLVKPVFFCNTEESACLLHEALQFSSCIMCIGFRDVERL